MSQVSEDIWKQRTALATQLQALYTRADGRELTAMEIGTEAQSLKEIRSLDSRLSNMLELQAGEARAQAGMADMPRSSAGYSNDSEFRRALMQRGAAFDVPLASVRTIVNSNGTYEIRSLVEGSGSGSTVIPRSVVSTFTQHMVAHAALLQCGPTVFNTASGEPLLVPVTSANAAASLINEGATIPASDAVFASVSMAAHKMGFMTQLSFELVNDAAVDLAGYLASMAGQAIGDLAGAYFITGTGTGQPQGILANCAAGPTAAGAATVTFDDLINLYYSVIPGYRPQASFLMNDATAAIVRKLKDSSGGYLWEPSTALGAPATILGRPVFTDPSVPVPATGVRSVLFGDFGRGYCVRNAGALRIERSDDFAFSTDMITLRFLMRTDGRVLVPSAVKALVHP